MGTIAGIFTKSLNKIFRAFRTFRGQKMGCGRQPAPSPFGHFVVQKEFLD
jgi:hypothetical protein